MKLLLVNEVADILRCSVSTVYSLLESGKLEGRRCPGWRVKPEDLERYVEGTKKEAPERAPVKSRPRPCLKNFSL